MANKFTLSFSNYKQKQAMSWMCHYGKDVFKNTLQNKNNFI